MKHKIQNSLIAMLVASAIFVSCSKDESLTAASGSVPRVVKTEKPVPVYDTGIMGSLSPAPLKADMKIIDDHGRFSADVPVTQDGSFRLGNIPPGAYYLFIAYISSADSPNDVSFKYLTVKDVTVRADGMTDLGVIRTP